MIEYKLIRSERKMIAIQITKDAKIHVRAPMKVPKKEIDRIVQLKENWITKHLAIKIAQQEQKSKFTLNYGDTIFYRGKEYPITAKHGNNSGFDETAFYLPQNFNSEQIKIALIKIYKQLAKRDLPIKVTQFAKLMNVAPNAIKINSAKTMWGSCNGKNNINFSWRLIFASDAVIDYVVVHELAHIKELNHSPRFWAVVESVLPDYKIRKKGLLSLQAKLATENWD